MSGAVAALLLDLDGVLVDTERPLLESLAAQFRARGVAGDVVAAAGEFRGKNLEYCLDELAAVLGTPVPRDFVDDVRRGGRVDVLSVEGASLPLSGAVPYRIVTNSARADALKTLARAGLIHLVDEAAIVAVDDVGRAKPAPDLYLAALRDLDTPACECVAVEDSLTGLLAARSAQVRPIGYSPDARHQAALRHAGFEVVPHLAYVAEIVRPRPLFEKGAIWLTMPSELS